jgi:predicted nucleotidyltransferase
MVGRKNKLELESLLDTVITKVTNGFDVDEIILFGSYAKGTENDLSDVDVAVISPDLDVKGTILKNSLIIKKKTKLYEPYLQLMAFPSETFYEEKFIDPGFIQEIKRTGRSIYKR